jgi:hypothetical protein
VSKGRKSILSAPKKEVAELPEMVDAAPERPGNSVSAVVLRARDLRIMDKNLFSKGGSSDPFAEVTVEGTVRRTSIKRRTLAPEWHERLDFDCELLGGSAVVRLYDHDQLSAADFMGVVLIDLEDLAERDQCRGWFPLLDEDLTEPDDDRSRGDVQRRNQSPVDGRPGISSNPSTSPQSNSFSMILEPLILASQVLDD